MSVTKHTSNVYYKVIGDKTVGLTKKQDQVNCENPHWEIFIYEKYSP